MRQRGPVRQCQDCRSEGWPECMARCDYCRAVGEGNMNTLGDRFNNRKLKDDLNVSVSVPVTGCITWDFEG